MLSSLAPNSLSVPVLLATHPSSTSVRQARAWIAKNGSEKASDISSATQSAIQHMVSAFAKALLHHPGLSKPFSAFSGMGLLATRTGTGLIGKRRPGTTSGAPGESHNYVEALFPLNQGGVAVVAGSGRAAALVSMLSTEVLTIFPTDVKGTSRVPFPHP